MIANAPGLRPIDDFAEAEALPTMGDRVEAVRRAGERFRGRLLDGGMATAVRTCDLITLPYPTPYAFWQAISHPAPYIMFTNRMLVVRYVDTEGVRRTLLFNPTDYVRAAEVPFYKRLAAKYGGPLSSWVLTQRHGSVEGHLRALGIAPEQVDYLSFDHLHTQDLRGWLGQEAYFPRAKLLVQRAEWRIFEHLHPLQEPWFIREGTAGVALDRVVFLDGDVQLGTGVALLSTPGHTWGNHSLAVATERGVTVVSENGVCLDSYSPEHSRLPGLREVARTGQEVVLNGNTLEGALDQYTSMIKEKAVAGPHPDDPAFCNHFSSSELTAHMLAPGLAPTRAQRAVHHGGL